LRAGAGQAAGQGIEAGVGVGKLRIQRIETRRAGGGAARDLGDAPVDGGEFLHRAVVVDNDVKSQLVGHDSPFARSRSARGSRECDPRVESNPPFGPTTIQP
jgi:hypothetical protein